MTSEDPVDHADSHNHDFDHPFSTWHWSCDQPLSLPKLRRVVEALPETIYRAKGIVCLEELPNYQIALQMVGKRTALADTALWGSQSPRSEIVLIASRGGIDSEALLSAFESCIGTGDESQSPILRLNRFLEMDPNGSQPSHAKRNARQASPGTLALAGLMMSSLTATAAAQTTESLGGKPPAGTNQTDAAMTEKLAEEAYVYALPILMSYKTMYQYSIAKGPNFKAPFNELKNTARVYGPKDTTVISANSDTPYSLLWMDLRAEPIVLSFPKIEAKRYFVAQTQDLSTYLLPYIGSRTTGNDGGTFMVTGPSWKGELPKGVDKLIPSQTDFAFTVYRTQLFNADDLKNVEEVQKGYKVQTLSSYLGKQAPPAAPKLDFPDWAGQKEPGKNFIEYLNFCLQFITPDEQDTAMWKKLAPIGVGPGKAYDFDKLPADQQAAVAKGVESASNKIVEASKKVTDTAGQTREGYKHDWLFRAVITKMGWGANDPREASYPILRTDSDGKGLDASKHNYTLTYEKGKLPPVKAFWSVTMYDGKSQLMVENTINRYLLNSTMLDGMKKGDDGSITLYFQKDSPGKDLEANWLPAPNGPFYMLMRLYGPEKAFLDGSWKLPAIQKTK